MLIQLIYVSSAVRLLSEEELLELLAQAREANRQRNVTGMLLYGEGNFLQVLEGEAADVDAVYAAIQQDPRHHHLLLIEREPIAARNFADWSMGFHRMSADELHAPGYAKLWEEELDGRRSATAPTVAIELLRDFSRR
jgi:hypothetical protein